MKKLISLYLLGALLLAGCEGADIQRKEAYRALLSQATICDTVGPLWQAAIDAAESGTAKDDARVMMSNQELSLQNTLSGSDIATIERRGDLLTVSLKGDVAFDSRSPKLKPGAQKKLDQIAELMLQYPETLILIVGYTDKTGKQSADHELSEQMAANVRNLLVMHGVAYTRIQAMAYCEPATKDKIPTETDSQPTPWLDIKIAPNNF